MRRLRGGRRPARARGRGRAGTASPRYTPREPLQRHTSINSTNDSKPSIFPRSPNRRASVRMAKLLVATVCVLDDFLSVAFLSLNFTRYAAHYTARATGDVEETVSTVRPLPSRSIRGGSHSETTAAITAREYRAGLLPTLVEQLPEV